MMTDESAAPSRTTRPHVCIVGAGVSGLRCAEILLQNDFQVTILEARNRIGGKICQSEKLGYVADIGPNWIHTSDDGHRHPLLDLAVSTNTPLHKWNSTQNIYSPAGSLLPLQKADEFSTLLWDLISEAQAFSAKDPMAIEKEKSLYDFFVEKSRELFTGDGGKGDRELLCQMSEMWGAYIGEPVERQSLRWCFLEEVCGGEELFIETNYKAILEAIAKEAVEKAEIKLNTRVIGVKSAERTLGGGKVSLVVENGNIISFDEVIMTTPLGWLKRNKHVFSPPLPPRLIAGIDGISVGHLEKVYITFPDAFWVDIPSDTDPLSLKPGERLKAAEDTFAGYSNWLSPSYAQDTNPNHWPQEIWNLAAFSLQHRKPTLIFYTYGPCSSYLTTLVHGLPDPEHHALLSDFFKPYYSLLPNYSPADPACLPKAILSTEWQKDELAGYGSYCNIQVGTEDAEGDMEAMRHGVPERRLWFCGEHTSPKEELGTVAGAYLSAEGVAGRLLGEYGVEWSI